MKMDLESLLDELWSFAASDLEELEKKIRSSLKGHSSEGLLKAISHLVIGGQHSTAKSLLQDYVKNHHAADDIQRRLELILHFKKHRTPPRLTLKSKQRDKETFLQEINQLVATSKLVAAEELLLEAIESAEEPDYLNLLSRVYILQRRPIDGAEAMQRALLLKRQQQAFIDLPEDESDLDIPTDSDLTFLSNSAEQLTRLEDPVTPGTSADDPVDDSLGYIQHTAFHYPALNDEGWWESLSRPALLGPSMNISVPDTVDARGALPEAKMEPAEEQSAKTEDAQEIPFNSTLKLAHPRKNKEPEDTSSGVKIFNKKGRLINVVQPTDRAILRNPGLALPHESSNPDVSATPIMSQTGVIDLTDENQEQLSPRDLEMVIPISQMANPKTDDTEELNENPHAEPDRAQTLDPLIPDKTPESDIPAPPQAVPPTVVESDEEDDGPSPLDDLEIDVPISHMRKFKHEDDQDPYELDFDSPDLTIEGLEGYQEDKHRPALDDFLDFDSDYDIYAFDPDDVFDNEDVLDADPTDFLARKLSREDRALQKAAGLVGNANWPLSALPLVHQIFIMSGWGATRLALEREIAKGLTPEELILASHIKVLWAENDIYWIVFDRTGSSRLSHQALSWPAALLIVRSFDSIPQVEEIEVLLEDLFTHWYESHSLRRTFKAFARYLWFRFANLHGCLPANQRFNYCNPRDLPFEEYSDLGLHDELEIEKTETLAAYGIFQVKHPQEPGCYFSDKIVKTEKPSRNTVSKDSNYSLVEAEVLEPVEGVEGNEGTSDPGGTEFQWPGNPDRTGFLVFSNETSTN